MRCVEEHRVLSLLKGQLAVDEFTEVERHLDGCEACLAMVAAAVPPLTVRSLAAHADAWELSSVRPGEKLAGRYRVVALLGVGASGQVLAAVDEVVDGSVALKLLRPGLARDPRWIARLSRELHIARQLNHPNICRVFDLVEADEQHFLVMELGQGSLQDELRHPGKRPGRAQALTDALAVATGLAAIHRAGIVHRDIKPENLLRMPGGRLAVSDFGLSSVASSQRGFTLFAGTPLYMAPELSDGEPASVASDMWSLGVVLHELFFGERPHWKSNSRRMTLEASKGGSAFSRDRPLQRLCRACLSLLPADRPRNVEEVERRLQAIISREPAGSWARAFGDRSPAARGMIAAGVAVLVVAGAILTTRLDVLRRSTSAQALPLVVLEMALTAATPATVADEVAEVLKGELGRQKGIELAHGPPRTSDQRRSFTIEVTGGLLPGALEPPSSASLVPLRVSLVLPDGDRPTALARECRRDFLGSCVVPRFVMPLRASLGTHLGRWIAAERTRLEPHAPARVAMERYYRLPLAQRMSGRSIDAQRLLRLAQDADPDSFTMRVERAWSQLVEARVNPLALSDLVQEARRLREDRPGELGLRSLECRAVTQLVVEDDSPTDAQLAGARRICEDASENELDHRPAEAALAVLDGQSCNVELLPWHFNRVLSDRETIADTPGFWPDALSTPPTHGGYLSPILLLSSLWPDENISRRAMISALITGAFDLQAGHLERAEKNFGRALEQAHTEEAWRGGVLHELDPPRAAALRGLIAVTRARGQSPPITLVEDLARNEVLPLGATADPEQTIITYLWVDPDHASNLLRQAPPPHGCAAKIRRAMIFQSLGDRAARDASLVSCTDKRAWIRECRSRLEGPIPPLSSLTYHQLRDVRNSEAITE
jgi:Protein kinase domain